MLRSVRNIMSITRFLQRAQTRTKQSGVTVTTVHHFSLEVRGKGTLAIRAILKGLVAVGTEGTRKHGDVAEHTLQWLVQNVGHLVLNEGTVMNHANQGID